MICTNPIVPSQSYIQEFLNRIKLCQKHMRRCQFVCLQKKCQSSLLFCVQCVPKHNGHNFLPIETYLKEQNRYEILTQGQSQKHRHFEDLMKLTNKKLNQIEQQVHNYIKQIRNSMKEMLDNLKFVGTRVSMERNQIDTKLMIDIKKYLEKQWSYSRCQKMKQCFDKALNAVKDSYANISEDLANFIEGEDWQNIQEHQYEVIQDKYFQHLHQHQKKIIDYFKFSREHKCPSIILRENDLQATFFRNSPSFPFVLCDRAITPQNNSWIIQIKACDSKLLFFNASTFFIGICKPETAKRMEFRFLNQGGRGAYMIGSNGWAYHHSNPNLDRQDIVGFSFGKGDRIKVQIEFQKGGIIRFKKLGKIYDNKFQMPLQLEEKILKYMKPCVGFADEIDATVRLINL